NIRNTGDGNSWIGTASSLELFDPRSEVFTHFRHDPADPASLNKNGPVMSMLQDKEGTLWIGTYQGGINKYDKYLTFFHTYKNNPNDPLSVSFNIITSFAEARNGDIWVATGGGALNLWKRQSNRFIRFEPDAANSNSLATWGLLSLCQSKKTACVWIGTYGSGMDCYDPNRKVFTHFKKGDGEDQLNNDAVYALMEDRRGHVWIGTNGGGVNVLNPVTKKIIK